MVDNTYCELCSLYIVVNLHLRSHVSSVYWASPFLVITRTKRGGAVRANWVCDRRRTRTRVLCWARQATFQNPFYVLLFHKAWFVFENKIMHVLFPYVTPCHPKTIFKNIEWPIIIIIVEYNRSSFFWEACCWRHHQENKDSSCSIPLYSHLHFLGWCMG